MDRFEEESEPKSRFLSLESLAQPILDRGVPLFQQFHPEPNLEAVEQLVKWAFEQTESVQEAIWEFLEDPEALLEKTIEKLGLQKLDEEHGRQRKREKGEKSLTQLVRDSLPASYDDLLLLIQANCINERPAATIRQILRRLTRTGQIVKIEEVFHNVEKD